MKTIHILKPVRTNNFADLGAKIIDHWNNFLALDLKRDINYGIYFNYDSNYKGNYDFSVGTDESFPDSIPLEIPTSKFKIFSCEQSQVFEKWQEIWELEEKNEIQRAYKYDFEKYFPHGKVEIYIGVL